MKPLSQLALTAPLWTVRSLSPNGGPAEAQRKYPQRVCRIRSAAKLLTAALLGSVGKGGVPQGDFLRAKGSERSFSPKGGNGVHGLFDDAGNVSFADKGAVQRGD